MKKAVYVSALISSVITTSVAGVVWLKYDEWFVLPKLRPMATINFVDPLSAQFRNEKLVAGGWLCGEVNAKNAYGGYTGFKRFFVRAGGEAYRENEGYIGTNDSPVHLKIKPSKTERMLARETEILKYVQEHRTSAPFSSLTEAEWQQSIFEQLWKEMCS